MERRQRQSRSLGLSTVCADLLSTARDSVRDSARVSPAGPGSKYLGRLSIASAAHATCVWDLSLSSKEVFRPVSVFPPLVYEVHFLVSPVWVCAKQGETNHGDVLLVSV